MIIVSMKEQASAISLAAKQRSNPKIPNPIAGISAPV